MNPHATIAEGLWQEYGYTVPDAPGNMAHTVLLVLHETGYRITHINEERPPA